MGILRAILKSLFALGTGAAVGAGATAALVKTQAIEVGSEVEAGRQTTSSTTTTLRDYVQSFNSNDRPRFLTLLAEGVRARAGGSQTELVGPTVIADSVWSLRQSFSDIRGEVVDMIAAGDRGILTVMWRGTNDGTLKTPLGVIPPTGRNVAWPACLIFTMQSGKITNIVDFTDFATLHRQVGVPFPPELEAPAA